MLLMMLRFFSDELVNKNLHLEVEKQNNLEREVSCFDPLLKLHSYARKAAFHINIAHKIRKVNHLLGKISNGTNLLRKSIRK